MPMDFKDDTLLPDVVMRGISRVPPLLLFFELFPVDPKREDAEVGVWDCVSTVSVMSPTVDSSDPRLLTAAAITRGGSALSLSIASRPAKSIRLYCEGILSNTSWGIKFEVEDE